MREIWWRLAVAVMLTMSVTLSCEAQESAQIFVQKMSQAAHNQRTLNADIQFIWKTSTGTKAASGTIRLMKPNYALIKLTGDYPLRVLASDGTTRYLAPDDKSYTQEPIDPHGEKIDTPWWGFPFRFFFGQSLNPFATVTNATEQLDTVLSESVDGRQFRVLQAHGNGPMGEYKAQFYFFGDVLERTIVQFSSGTKSGVFEAKLSNVHVNVTYSARSFHFVPVAGQEPASISSGMLAIGEKAPDFTLPTPEGKPLTLSTQLQGKKATLVNFWYYNCAPCRIEFPEFEKLYEQYRGQGFTIVAVNRGDSAKTVSDYAHRAGLEFPIALGGEFGRPGVFANYKVSEEFPQTYLLDAEGRIVYRTAGMDIDGLKRALQQIGLR